MITAGSQKAIFYEIRARACIGPELLMGSSRDHLFMQKLQKNLLCTVLRTVRQRTITKKQTHY